jgi:hypothetical protein
MELVEDEEEAHDLGIGADFSGELEPSGFEEEEAAPVATPDFGSDFVEMPDDDEPGGFEPGSFEPEGVEDEGVFGGDLVQGPDFGGPATDTVGVEDPSGASVDTGAPPAEVPPEEGAEPEKPREAPKRRPPPKKKAPVGKYVTMALILGALGAVGGTAFGFLNIPGLTVLQEYTGSVPDPALTLPGAQPTDQVIQYSLVIFDDYSENNLDQARGMVEALELELPQFNFFLTPLVVDGTVTYFVMAGPAYTPLEAEDIRTPLQVELPREDADLWAVRPTPRAFYLGGRETLAEAQEFLAGIEEGGIDAYILQFSYDDGSTGFVVLTGGFESVEEARRMQIILRRAGFGDAPLIERRGLYPG